TCIADIDTTIPGKAYTSISGDGSPESDTLCSFVSYNTVYGDFDMNISFEILQEGPVDNAINFQLIDIPSSANATQFVFISLSNWTGAGTYYEVFAEDRNVSGYLSSRPTEDTSGMFRINRSGKNFTFYTWNSTDSSWIEESSVILNLSKALFISMESESTYPAWGTMNVSWENLSVSSSPYWHGIFDNSLHAIGIYNVSFYVNDSRGAVNDTETTNFTLYLGNERPTTPFILAPYVDEVVNGLYNITWSTVFDYDGDSVQFNITLLNPDGSDNATIVSEYGDINSNSYEWNTSEFPDGEYSIRVLVYENESFSAQSNKYTIPGTFFINNNPPVVIVLEPIDGVYPNNRPVPIAINATDSDGINISIATVYHPISNTTQNITLYPQPVGDNFTSDSVGTVWFVENISIGPSQTCIADINTTIPGKAYTSLFGDGSPEVDTLCSLVSYNTIYGDFDMNVSFEILQQGPVDNAINFQVLEINSSENSVNLAFISLSNWTGLGRNYEVFVDDGNVSEYLSTVPTEDTYGKFRIKREGTNFSFYIWNNTDDSWILLNSSILNLNNALYYSIESESAYSGWGTMNASWDNLSISANDYRSNVLYDPGHLAVVHNISFYVTDNHGGINDTEKTNFTLIAVNSPPTKPFILAPPVNEIISGIYTIVWSGVVDPDGDSLLFNITLLNPDGSDNETIISDYGNASSTSYEWNTSLFEDGEYSLRVTVYENETPEELSNSYILPGTFFINNNAPTVTIISPLGEEYPFLRPVSISIEAYDSSGINSSIAQITYSNGSTMNLILEKGQQSDNFTTDSIGINWSTESVLVGPFQDCIADIDNSIAGKAYTSLTGDGSPESDTLCSIISDKAIDGDFNITIDFNIESMNGTDHAINFQLTEIPSSADVARMIFMSLSTWTGFGHNYEIFVDDGNFSDYILTRETNDTSGRFMISRINNTFTFFTWNSSDSSWIEENVSQNEFDFSRAVYVSFESESAYPDWGSMEASWDNFIVQDSNHTFGIFNDTSNLGIYNVTINVTDNLGAVNDSEKTNFTVVYVNYPPSKPFLLVPYPGAIIESLYNITWSSVNDFNNDNVQFNITLLNPDLSDNATLISGYGDINSISYEWNTSLFEDGEYSLRITVYENETAEELSNSYELIGNFTIDNNVPSIEFEPPTEISGTGANRNFILVNASASDITLNLITIYLYNSSLDVINTTYSSSSPAFANFTNLPAGIYYFNATAVDYLGHENSTELRNVTIYYANVSVLKLDQTAQQPSPGGIVEFNFTITNTGNVTLDPVEVQDLLPSGLSYSSASIVPDSTANPIVWNNLGPISSGAQVIIYLNATVDAGVINSTIQTLNLTNYVNATGTPPIGADMFTESEANVTIYYANVSVLKLDQTAAQPSPGGIVEFNITITNTGNVSLNPVEVQDLLPSGLAYSAASIAPDSTANPIVWNNIGPIAPGAQVIIYLNATATGACDLNVT
ncbi:DUF11 domain-containing protein, partial [Candidatus Micrarchaeota archaeon]|nr:DUF11 domain-containing protein [Candidatus Micrarchaeota archaeon]